MATSEIRNINIMSAVEPSLYALARISATEDGDSMSSYVRNLIIWDLVARKKLDTHMIAMILTGKALKRIEGFLKIAAATLPDEEQAS